MRRIAHTRIAILFVFLLIGATVCVGEDLPDCDGWLVALSVTPEQPDCTDAITLVATQWLMNTCWTTGPSVFSDVPPDFSFELTSIDLWEPGRDCYQMIVELPFARQVGPLPAGPYSVAVTHRSTSLQPVVSACSVRTTFDVTCCAEVPPEVPSLRAELTAAGTEIRLTWDDVVGADDYVVFGADEPDQPFTRQIAIAANGAAGVGLATATAPGFFLVGARNGCGIGPRH